MSVTTAASAAKSPMLLEFLTYLAVDQRVSASTQNQAFSARLFLYREWPILNVESGCVMG